MEDKIVDKELTGNLFRIRGRPKGNIEQKKYNLIEGLIEQNLSYQEISDILKANYSSIYNYLRTHPELPRPKKKNHLSLEQITEIVNVYEKYDGNAHIASRNLHHASETITKYWRGAGLEIRKRGQLLGTIRDNKKYSLIEQLIKDGLSQTEIARKLKATRQSISFYIKMYPKLAKPRDTRIGPRNISQYNQIKNLIEDELSQSEIGRRLKTTQKNISRYVNRYPELRKIYDDLKSIK